PSAASAAGFVPPVPGGAWHRPRPTWSSKSFPWRASWTASPTPWRGLWRRGRGAHAHRSSLCKRAGLFLACQHPGPGPSARSVGAPDPLTARGAVSLERLAQDANGELVYTFTHPWSDGTTGIRLSPLELLEKLAALVPLPRMHLVRYGGCLAPHSHLRG